VSAFQNGAPLQLQDGAALTLVTDMTNKSNTLKKIPLWEADTTIIHNVEGLNEEAKHVKMPQAFPVSRGASWQLNGEKANVSETQKVEFSIKRLDTWVNCDALIPFEQGGLTTLLVYVNQNHIPSVNDEVLYLEQTAEVYFKPDGLNSLIKLYNPILTRLADKRGFYSYENSMPVGMSGQLLAFIRYKEHFFVDLKRITISVPPVGKNFSHVTVQPIEVSKATFLDMVKRLDD
jgi:hypothetical protein